MTTPLHLTQRTLRRDQGGWATATLLIALTPLVLLAGAGVLSQAGRRATTTNAIDQERALEAAEAGLDAAIHAGTIGTLVNNTPITATLAPGVSYSARPVDTHTDHVDNDGDGSTDEADEVGYQITSAGTYKGVTRRVVGWIQVPAALPTPAAAVSMQDPAGYMSISGTSFTVSGIDRNINGTAGPGPNLPGASIVSPGTVASLTASLSAAQKSRITGTGSSPSATATTTTVDVAGLVNTLHSAANTSLTAGHYTSVPDFGTPTTGGWRITYASGNIRLSGNQSGAGILAVNGDLEFNGNITFIGLVLVTGNISFTGGGSSKMIRGGLVVDGNTSVGSDFAISGGVDIQYSSQAIQGIQSLVSHYRLMGWKEIARQ